MYGGNNVQSTSQTKFENADNQVDVTSQTDFEDDDRSMVVNVGSGSDSDDSNDSGSEFSDRSDDESLDDFCHLDIWGAINKWSGDKTGKQKLKFVQNRLFKLTLLSRALHRDEICNSIMRIAERFKANFSMGFDEVLEHAVFKRRFLIHD